MCTKLFPTAGKGMSMMTTEEWTHKPADVRAGLMASLKALKTEKLEIFYLHGPDRKTSYEETMREVNKLHEEGHFARFGLSDFMSWEVAQICEICEKNGWIKPTVYQGIYNLFNRSVEHELIPCLRHYGISLYAFQPLAGGILTGKIGRDPATNAGTRFDTGSWVGKMHSGRYISDVSFDAVDMIREAGQKHDLSMVECVLRWMTHHSALKTDLGDSLIIGATRPSQLEETLTALENGPLPEEVVEAMEKASVLFTGTQQRYAQ